MAALFMRAPPPSFAERFDELRTSFSVNFAKALPRFFGKNSPSSRIVEWIP